MDLTDELARLEQRMKELQAEAERLTAELEQIGRHVAPNVESAPPLLRLDEIGESQHAPNG